MAVLTILIALLSSIGISTVFAGPLHDAVFNNDILQVKGFLNDGTSVNQRDSEGKTPLHVGASYASAEIVTLLLKSGGDVNLTTKDGVSPLHISVVKGRPEISKLLLENNANVNAKDQDGNTPLHVAGEKGNTEIIKILMLYGVSLQSTNKKGFTPIFAAVVGGQKEALQILISRGAEVNTRAMNNWSPLHVALSKEKPEIASFLIKNNADVNVPLDYKEKLEQLEKMELKQVIDEKIVIRNLNGMTPLHFAIEKGYTQIVKMLADNGAKMNSMAGLGRTPVQWCITMAPYAKKEEILRVLIKFGADVNEIDHRGITHLHLVALTNKNSLIPVLLENGANVNATSPKGETPLHFAVKRENLEGARLLVAANSDRGIKNEDGMRPVDLAGKKGNLEMVRIVREAKDETVKIEGGIDHLFTAFGNSFIETVFFPINIFRSDRGEESDDIVYENHSFGEIGRGAGFLMGLSVYFLVFVVMLSHFQSNKSKKKVRKTKFLSEKIDKY